MRPARPRRACGIISALSPLRSARAMSRSIPRASAMCGTTVGRAAMRLKAVLTPGDDVPFLVALTQRLWSRALRTRRASTDGAFPMAASWWSAWPASSRNFLPPIPWPWRPRPPITARNASPRGRCRSCSFTARPMASLPGWLLDAARRHAVRARQRCALCQARPMHRGERSGLPDLVGMDATTVSVRRYTGCAGGAEVALYRIERGGHQSPARVETKPGLATPFLGPAQPRHRHGRGSLAFSPASAWKARCSGRHRRPCRHRPSPPSSAGPSSPPPRFSGE